MTSTWIQRFVSPERNVGGGDLVTRVLSTSVLLLFIGIVVPQSHVPYPLLKIALLMGALMGLVSLMLALFLKSKTYFAGVQLFPASLILLWFAKHQLTYVAAVIGLVFLAAGIAEIATRRSRLNGLLGVSSFHVPSGDASLLEVALREEAADPGPLPVSPPKPHANSGAK